MVRSRLDESNSELISILEHLLSENIKVSAREVAKRHSCYKSASTITRDNARRQLLENYQQRQVELDQWHRRISKKSKDSVAMELEQLRSRLEQAERNESILLQAHVSLVSVVAELGGMEKLKDYYAHFRELRQSLEGLDALPSAACVTATLRESEKQR